MPQILIDTDASSKADLIAISLLLRDCAARMADAPAAPAAPQRADVPAAPSVQLTLAAPEAPAHDMDPAKVFGANSTAPFVPPLAPAPTLAPEGTPAAATAPPIATTSASPSSTDKTGLPWDARIHSETKAINKDGTWRTRRGLAAGVLESVTAELRAPSTGVPPAPPSVPLPPPVITVVDTPAPVAAVPAPPVPVAPSVPLPPAAPGIPAVVLPGATAVAVDFRGLMTKVSSLLNAGKLQHPQVIEACKSAGAENLQGLAAAPDKVLLVDAYLNKLLGL